MLGRELRTRLDLLRENNTSERSSEKQIENYAGKRDLYLNVNDTVFVRDYRNVNKPT